MCDHVHSLSIRRLGPPTTPIPRVPEDGSISSGEGLWELASSWGKSSRCWTSLLRNVTLASDTEPDSGYRFSCKETQSRQAALPPFLLARCQREEYELAGLRHISPRLSRREPESAHLGQDTPSACQCAKRSIFGGRHCAKGCLRWFPTMFGWRPLAQGQAVTKQATAMGNGAALPRMLAGRGRNFGARRHDRTSRCMTGESYTKVPSFDFEIALAVETWQEDRA